jgi:hypothetical protein
MALSKTARTDQQVECSRCGLHRGLLVHRLTSDANKCPRCLDEDGVDAHMTVCPPLRSVDQVVPADTDSH